MAIHTFSTKTKKPEDEEVVQFLKHYCARHNLNFSAVVVQLISDHAEVLKETVANAES